MAVANGGPTRTVVELRDYVDEILERMDRYYDARFMAIQEALRVALTANEKRLDALNELRAMLADQQNRFALRETIDARFSQITSDIRSLQTSRDTMAGMASQKSVGYAQLMGGAALIVAIIGLLAKFIV